MKSRIPSFKDLEVWQKAMTPVTRVYEITETYPDREKFGLTAETRKSARSVPANIAEGKMRTSPADFRRHVAIALGSLGETQTQLLLGGRLRYLPNETVEAVEKDLEEIGRMLRGLERALVVAG